MKHPISKDMRFSTGTIVTQNMERIADVAITDGRLRFARYTYGRGREAGGGRAGFFYCNGFRFMAESVLAPSGLVLAHHRLYGDTGRVEFAAAEQHNLSVELFGVDASIVRVDAAGRDVRLEEGPFTDILACTFEARLVVPFAAGSLSVSFSTAEPQRSRLAEPWSVAR